MSRSPIVTKHLEERGMLLPPDLLPPDLLRAIRAFLVLRPDLRRGTWAGECVGVSESFVELLIVAGQRGKLETFDLDEHRPMPCLYPLVDDPGRNGQPSFGDHCVAVCQDIVIDWTPRQFNKKLPVPFLYPAKELERRFYGATASPPPAPR